MIKFSFSIFLILALIKDSISQEFSFPLKGRMEINSNFGEIRPNHFHAGIDLYTPSNSSVELLSIDDGYVSRIKVGTNGYGKVVYITHPNGKVSVYAHQSKFAPRINQFILEKQKSLETFEIDISLKQDEIPVIKNEVIGYSGNTGNSTGPHLHFEIRNSKNDAALNPLSFYKIEDKIAPELKSIYFFDFSDPNNPVPKKSVTVSNRNFKIKNGEFLLLDTIELVGEFGIGIVAFDKLFNNDGLKQIYEAEIEFDNEKIFSFRMDSIPFEETRYVNCFTDPVGKLKHKKIMKCFRSKNQELSIIKFINKSGSILFSKPNGVLKIHIKDISGNETRYQIFTKKIMGSVSSLKSYSYDCNKENILKKEGISLLILPKTFYNDFNLKIEEIESIQNKYSNTIDVSGYEMPLMKNCKIEITPKIKEDSLWTKLYMYNLSTKSYCEVQNSNGKIIGETKQLGKFELRLDTIKPKIEPLFLGVKFDVKGGRVSFRVKDFESGIKDFKMFINDEWVYSEYEHKDDLIFHDFNEKSKFDAIKLVVRDKKGNTSECKIDLKY